MASGFESERSLAARKEERRRQREALLKQAKADYEKEEHRKELKRLRGEDKWMLPDVNERLEELEKEHSISKKKKKEKHSKKHKKEKKHKVEKTADSSDSSDSSEEWVEASVSHSSSADKAWKLKKEPSNSVGSPTAVQRDEWMTLDFMSVKTLSSASLKAEKQREKVLEQQKAQANEQALLADRELNPYWKDGGTGLPPLEVAPSRKAAAIEDGGLSWLKKSYQRMKEQSEREKRDLDEIVAERYGSVEQFQSRLETAEASTLRNKNYYKRYEQKSKYSEKECSMKQREAKEKQEESSVGKYPYVEHPKKMDDGEWRHYKRERPREDKELGSKDVSYRTSNPIRRYEQPLRSHLKAAFLKPSDDRDQESKIQNPSSQLLTPGFMSCGFRKPGGGDDDNIPRWRKTQPKEETGKGAQDEKYFKPELSTPNKEKEPREDPEESQDSTLERKEALNSSPSCLGSLSEDENPCILSDEEMNRLGARIIKAELMGNKDLAAKLQATLNSARKLKDSGTQSQSRGLERKTTGFQDEHEVVLVRTDKSGGAWPVNVPGETLEPTGRRRKTLKVTTHVDKERIRYFQDDDNLTLKDLVRNEKMGTAEDQNKLFMRMASKFTDKTDREYYTLDDMFVSTAAKGECSGAEVSRQRNQAIREQRQLAIQMEKCPHCFGSPEVPKHLIIAIGNKVYLSLPNYQSLTEGHCLITPMQHYTAATLLDEDIWEEIQVFRKTLVTMFEAQGLDCVFLEINLSVKKRYHMVYECIPLPKEVGDMAPIYFKKAIMESDEEWSMNKKLIDLSSKDVRRAVPKGLPYFCVDFGLQGGFAHVIEDQHKFPVYFGKEIIGGMLDLEPRLWRKRLRENFEDQRKKVLQFAQKWKPYDFTKNKD